MNVTISFLLNFHVKFQELFSFHWCEMHWENSNKITVFMG